MLNKEKFAKEIVEILLNGKDVGVVNGVPCSCYKIYCEDCDLHCGACTEGFKKWANSEYKEFEIDWDMVPWTRQFGSGTTIINIRKKGIMLEEME